MLVAGNVNAVFHGHDHFFANQLHDDGIYYLEVGQAGSANYNQKASEYGYISGDFLGSSGYMRVTVNSSEAVLQCVRAYHPDDEGGKKTGYTGDIDFEFIIEASNPADPVPGDIDHSGSIDLTDLIISLQVSSMTGTETESVNALADMNNDAKIGIEEAVYIIRYYAENL